MKSGPTLNGWTTRPRRRSAAIRPMVTVVLPAPLWVPPTTIALRVAKSAQGTMPPDEDRLAPAQRDRHDLRARPLRLAGRGFAGLQLAGRSPGQAARGPQQDRRFRAERDADRRHRLFLEAGEPFPLLRRRRA